MVFTWCHIASRQSATTQLSTAPSQATHKNVQSRTANGSQELVGMAQEKKSSYQKQTAKAPKSDSLKNIAPVKGTVSAKNAGKQSPSPSNYAKSADSQFDNGDDTIGGCIAAGDLTSLAARAVEALVIDSDETLSSDPREAAVLAMQDNELEENDDSKAIAALDLLSKAIDGNFNAEDKTDFLALASDVSEKAGISINPLVTHALKPEQPLVLQRQALYLATNCNIDLVENIASQSKHPLQQDAQSFLLQNELAQGRRPPPIDEDAIGGSQDETK